LGVFCKKTERGRIGVATVIRWGSRAPLPPSAAANTTACACASTQLLTCLRHQATWMPKTCFPPPLSTSVDGVALFAILEQENADNHPLRIHLTRSLSSQIELPTISATPLRTQRTPTSTFFPSQSPGLPFLLQLRPSLPPRPLLRGRAIPGGTKPW